MRILLSFLFLMGFTSISAQALFIGSDSSITIKSNTTLNIYGLGLKPLVDYTIPSNTTLERSSIPAITGNLSISRQFILTPSLKSYRGILVFQYEDSELTGSLDLETELQLQLYNHTNSRWTPYEAEIDTYANQMTYNFTAVVSFSAIAADYPETLKIDSPILNLSIKLYPNPTADKVYIEHQHPIRTKLYNITGQLIAKGNTNEIDLTAYKHAIYFLYIEDSINQNTQMFKIVKL
jgi:hypothetical protein